MRIFKPSSAFSSAGALIKQWEWTRSGGLFVVFNDGLRMKSEHTLGELLSTAQPEGPVVEITPTITQEET